MTQQIKETTLGGPEELWEWLKVGFIQTTIDKNLAWNKYGKDPLNMPSFVQEKAWQEIKKGFCNLKDHTDKPHIIVIPELSVPHCYVNELKNLSKAIGALVIAGLDFVLVGENGVSNKAIVIKPQNWPEDKKSKMTTEVYFGKTFFSKREKDYFGKFGKHCLSYPATHIFDAGPFGKIGVAICSDFFDIERFVIYKGHIHHLIVIAYNKDVNSYYFLAEAISRLVYCNVIICNSGFYGDSLAFAPYDKDYRRIIYRHKGQNLFATQVVDLPVKSLDDAQNEQDSCKEFKTKPPGYIKKPNIY